MPQIIAFLVGSALFLTILFFLIYFFYKENLLIEECKNNLDESIKTLIDNYICGYFYGYHNINKSLLINELEKHNTSYFNKLIKVIETGGYGDCPMKDLVILSKIIGAYKPYWYYL